MNTDALRRPLGIDEVDFRIQSINKGGYATILVYKDARADMIRLDEAVGPLGWKREHSNGNANCTVSLYNSETGQWVSKEDTGSESNTEAAKGLASDSFKRACFNWGIGRELYDYPLISVKLFDNEVDKSGQRPRATWDLKLKEWTWFSQFEDGKLVFLAAKDEKGRKRFAWGTYNPDIKEESTGGQTSDSNPEAVPATKVAEESNPKGVLKKEAEPVDDNPEVLQSGHPASFEDDERAALAEEYEKYFKKKPHGRMKNESIRQAIDELLDSLDDEPKETETPEISIEVEQEPAKDETIEDSDLWPYVLEIDNHEDHDVFVKWAKAIVTEYEDSPFIKDFKELCNEHYAKISK
jgi:hypothetical protein